MCLVLSHARQPIAVVKEAREIGFQLAHAREVLFPDAEQHLGIESLIQKPRQFLGKHPTDWLWLKNKQLLELVKHEHERLRGGCGTRFDQLLHRRGVASVPKRAAKVR